MKPGTRIADRYVIESELGRGGMGAVYLALDTKFRERIALKVGTSSESEFKERFEREARIGNKLGRVSGVVRAFDWGQVGEGSEGLYLAMDLVEGARPLDLVDGSLPERLARLRNAARLVALVHRKGVIHRDLKPANFLQANDGAIFIADFGLAKFKDESETRGPRDAELTQTGASMGTPRYMPPEQFEDSSHVDERADVYALGVMLFAALVGGKVPYEGSTANIVMAQDGVRRKRIRAPRPSLVGSNVPSELDTLCARAIEVDRDQRLPRVEAFIAGLDSFLEGPDQKTVQSGPTKAVEAPPAAATWMLAPIGCMLALLGLAGMAVAFVIMRPEPPLPPLETPPPIPTPVVRPVPPEPPPPAAQPPPPAPQPPPADPPSPPASVPTLPPPPVVVPEKVEPSTRDAVLAKWGEFVAANKDRTRRDEARVLLGKVDALVARWPEAPTWVMVGVKLLEQNGTEAKALIPKQGPESVIGNAFYTLGTWPDATPKDHHVRSNATASARGQRSNVAKADQDLFDDLLKALTTAPRVASR